MPIRIDEIAKKLGIDSRIVLAKAKELGITTVKVGSSTLDKITGEYLKEELRKSLPSQNVVSSLPLPNNGSLAQLEEASSQPTAAPLPRPTITVAAIGAGLHHLLEQILEGEVRFSIEVAECQGAEPLRVCLTKDAGASLPRLKAKLDLPARTEPDERTRELLRLAYGHARYHSGKEWVNLADYGNALKKEDQTFQPQDYGEKSLGSLLRRLADVFEIRADETNPIVHYIRLRVEKPHSPSSVPAQAHPNSSLQTGQSGIAVPPVQACGKIHNLKLGFGFIMPDDGSENLFFHATEVIGCTIFDLQPGDPVEYEPGMNEKGPCARKVRRLV